MTAPLFHLSPGALQDAVVGSIISLTGAEAHHAAVVMRLRVGEHIQLSDTVSTRVQGRIIHAESAELRVEVIQLNQEEASRPALVLVQALAKDRRDLQAVESATELGVDAVIPWQAERSVAKWKAERVSKKHAEWQNLATAAAKQTRRTSLPVVKDLVSTAQYAQMLQHSVQRIGVILLHEAEDQPLRRALAKLGLDVEDQHQDAGSELDELHLVVGPEGGISDVELEALRAVGAQPARLGPTVLRSSTAGPTAIAAVQLLLGRWEN